MNHLLTKSSLPSISLVGRPNVGKSALFNRLAKRRASIVHEEPGVTRDRMYVNVNWQNKNMQLIDTGGLEPGSTAQLMKGILRQTQMAIDESDLIVLMVDAVLGPQPGDYEIAKILRKSKKPILVAVNKSDSEKLEISSHEFFALGFNICVPISVLQGKGIETLLTEIFLKLPEQEALPVETEEEVVEPDFFDADFDPEAELEPAPSLDLDSDTISVAIIGKPNAGKSSFLNKLIGEERHLVSEEPGTTLDAVDSNFEYGGQKFRLIDTAGIRKKRSIYRDLEKMAVSSSLGALDRCSVAIMLVDALEGITEQDLKVAAFADKKAKGIVIVVNKWDLAKGKGLKIDEYTQQIRDQVPFLSFAPILYISALTGSRVFDVLDVVKEIAEQYKKRISTAQVNKVLQSAQDAHQLPVCKGRRVKIFYGTQVSVAPPIFLFTCNDPDGIHFSYRRFLINQIRETFGFTGVPVRLVFRARDKVKK